jgi:predicted nucleotidyltransferase
MLRGIMTASVSLDLPPRYLDKVRAILRQYVPDYDVWAYGSRVRGGAFEASDLDLVVRNPPPSAATLRFEQEYWNVLEPQPPAVLRG